MTPRHLVWIAAAIVALLLVWGLGRVLRSSGDSTRGDFQLAGAAADSADTVTVSAPAGTSVLVRVDSARWTVNGKPAAAAAVAELVAALRDTTPAELAAQSTASFARMGVDSAAATRIRAVQGARLLTDVLISPRGPDATSAYVRVPGDSAVYAQRGQLGAMARRGLDDWRDKTIAVTNPDSVGVIELRRGARTIVLRRGAGGWRLGVAGADSGAVARLLERYRALFAAGFATPDQLPSAFRARVDASTTLRTRSGTVLLQLEFDSTAAGYWARKAGAARDEVYRMDSWAVAELLPADSTLRGQP